MLRFILRDRGRDQYNGSEWDSLRTLDLDLPELEAELIAGGYSESGFSKTDLAGVSVVSDHESNQAETALQIIATWAGCDDSSSETREKAMQDIKKKAMEALGKST